MLSAVNSLAPTKAQAKSETSWVVFGEDWHGLPSSTQHIFKSLCETDQVLWVNSIGLRRPRLCVTDIKRAVKKCFAFLMPFKKQSATSINTMPDNLSVINILTWPAPSSRIARRFCALLIAWQVRIAMKKRGIIRPILWVTLPTAGDACQFIPKKRVFYYCCDDFSSLAGVDHSIVTRHENDLAQRADLIITSQQSLQKKWPDKPSRYLPHGVDFRLFSTPAPRAPELPRFGPVVGFYGSIATWLDQSLIRYAATKLPKWQFVFVGAVQTDVGELSSLANVHFLGPKPHAALPSFSQHWNISVLPFKQCPQITHCNPLKLREYLAAGTPVVSTRFAAAEDYQAQITLCDSREDFVAALQTSYVRSTSQAYEARLWRQQVVASEAWAERASTIKTWLGQ